MDIHPFLNNYHVTEETGNKWAKTQFKKLWWFQESHSFWHVSVQYEVAWEVKSEAQVLELCPGVHHFPSYKSCLWWGLEKLECESVTVMEVSCQTGRQVAATQGWSAPWHAKRPGLWHAVLSDRLWREAGWRWGDKNQGLSGGKRKDELSCSPHWAGSTIFDFALLRQLWMRCVHGADGCVYTASQRWGVCVCGCSCVCVFCILKNVYQKAADDIFLKHKSTLYDYVFCKTVDLLFYPNRWTDGFYVNDSHDFEELKRTPLFCELQFKGCIQRICCSQRLCRMAGGFMVVVR